MLFMTFFNISYEPRHHFVVQKIITHILTLKKNYVIKNRVMCATEPDFAKMSVNDTVSKTSNMASAVLLCHLGCRAKRVKCYGRREKNSPTATINSRMSIYKRKQ